MWSTDSWPFYRWVGTVNPRDVCCQAIAHVLKCHGGVASNAPAPVWLQGRNAAMMSADPAVPRCIFVRSDFFTQITHDLEGKNMKMFPWCINVQDADLIFLPVNSDHHWALVVVDVKFKRMFYCDSFYKEVGNCSGRTVLRVAWSSSTPTLLDMLLAC